MTLPLFTTQLMKRKLLFTNLSRVRLILVHFNPLKFSVRVFQIWDFTSSYDLSDGIIEFLNLVETIEYIGIPIELKSILGLSRYDEYNLKIVNINLTDNYSYMEPTYSFTIKYFILGMKSDKGISRSY